MANLRRRSSDSLRLRVSSTRTVPLQPVETPPVFPWPVAALGGGALAALSGLLVVSGVLLVAWLSASSIALPVVMESSARWWLLAHGVPIEISGSATTLVPLGLTVLFGVFSASAGGFAFAQGRRSHLSELTPRLRHRLAWGVLAQVVVGYTAVVVIMSLSVLGGRDLVSALVGGLTVSLIGAGIGVALAGGVQPEIWRDTWWGDSLRGGLSGAATLVIGGAVLLAAAVALAEPQIMDLEKSLSLDGPGGFVWVILTLAYLPNLLAWTLSWALGAGFLVGIDTVVSLSNVEWGLLPGIPVLGALPPPGLGSTWWLGWLGLGVIAGGVAGMVACWRYQGGLVAALGRAVLAGLTVVGFHLGWAAASRGSLGDLRLVDLGPRLLESLLISAPLLFLSAVTIAMITWFVRRRRPES